MAQSRFPFLVSFSNISFSKTFHLHPPYLFLSFLSNSSIFQLRTTRSCKVTITFSHPPWPLQVPSEEMPNSRTAKLSAIGEGMLCAQGAYKVAPSAGRSYESETYVRFHLFQLHLLQLQDEDKISANRSSSEPNKIENLAKRVGVKAPKADHGNPQGGSF